MWAGRLGVRLLLQETVEQRLLGQLPPGQLLQLAGEAAGLPAGRLGQADGSASSADLLETVEQLIFPPAR